MISLLFSENGDYSGYDFQYVVGSGNSQLDVSDAQYFNQLIGKDIFSTENTYDFAVKKLQVAGYKPILVSIYVEQSDLNPVEFKFNGDFKEFKTWIKGLKNQLI